MIRRLPAVVATLALVAAGLTLTPPTEARADDFCNYYDETKPSITGFAPGTVTLGLNSKLVTFSVRATDNCPIDDWTMTTPDKLLFFVYQDNPKETLSPYDNDDAGATAVDVEVYDQAYNVQKRRFAFRLLRQTRWQDVNASPEPARKGQQVRITATLQRADWEKNAYVRFGGRSERATLEFRAKKSKKWTRVKSVGFASKGRVSTSVTVKGTLARDGSYRLRFAGTGTSSPATSGSDYVDVK